MSIVKKEDAWDADMYDDKHGFVSEYGKDLISLLSPQANEKILDLGCGTGDLSYEVSGFGAEVIGIDASANMIAKAKDKYPHLDFKLMDATKLDFCEQFDAVYSNAVLHWIKEPQKVLKSVYAAIKPGGRFIAEFGGKGNVKSITDTVINIIKQMGYKLSENDFPWYFPSLGQYAFLMEQTGFTVTYAAYFDRPTKLADGDKGLQNWINMFSRSFINQLPDHSRDKIYKEAEDALRCKSYKDGSWFADYKRLRVKGTKDLI